MKQTEMQATFTAAQAMTVRASIEMRIARHIQGAYSEILEVGRCLIEAKESGVVPHGEWEQWVESQTGMGIRAAQRLMQAAREVSPGSAMERLPISKIQAILTLPEPERESMARRVEDESMSLRQLQQEVDRVVGQLQREMARSDALVKAGSRDRQSHEAEKNLLKDQLNKAAQSRAQADEEIARLRSQVESLLSDQGISPKARAEIDRLQEELAQAVTNGARQAHLRQQAQEEMLAMRQQAARGAGDRAPRRGVLEITAEGVRSFIAAVGVVPHMPDLASLGTYERQQLEGYLAMVTNWATAVRAAADTLVVEGQVAEHDR